MTLNTSCVNLAEWHAIELPLVHPLSTVSYTCIWRRNCFWTTSVLIFNLQCGKSIQRDVPCSIILVSWESMGQWKSTCFSSSASFWELSFVTKRMVRYIRTYMYIKQSWQIKVLMKMLCLDIIIITKTTLEWQGW